MFSKKDVGIGDWLVFWFLMAIPFVNVLVWLVLLLSSGTNKSIKNLLFAQVVVVILAIGIFMVFGAAIMSMIDLDQFPV